MKSMVMSCSFEWSCICGDYGSKILNPNNPDTKLLPKLNKPELPPAQSSTPIGNPVFPKPEITPTVLLFVPVAVLKKPDIYPRSPVGSAPVAVLKKPEEGAPLFPNPELTRPESVVKPNPLFVSPAFQKPVLALPELPPPVLTNPVLFHPVFAPPALPKPVLKIPPLPTPVFTAPEFPKPKFTEPEFPTPMLLTWPGLTALMPELKMPMLPSPELKKPMLLWPELPNPKFPLPEFSRPARLMPT